MTDISKLVDPALLDLIDRKVAEARTAGANEERSLHWMETDRKIREAVDAERDRIIRRIYDHGDDATWVEPLIESIRKDVMNLAEEIAAALEQSGDDETDEDATIQRVLDARPVVGYRCEKHGLVEPASNEVDGTVHTYYESRPCGLPLVALIERG